MNRAESYLLAAMLYAGLLLILAALASRSGTPPRIALPASAATLLLLITAARGYLKHPILDALLDYAIFVGILSSPLIIDHQLVSQILPLHVILEHRVVHVGYSYTARVVTIDPGQLAALALALKVWNAYKRRRKYKRSSA